MEEKSINKGHRISFHARKNGTITGVVDVLSFDLSEILLETDQGMLMIKGSDLHVNRLTLEKGEVDVEGKIDSLTYSDAAGYGNTAGSFFSRLFK